jgi:hypothetical protein
VPKARDLRCSPMPPARISARWGLRPQTPAIVLYTVFNPNTCMPPSYLYLVSDLSNCMPPSYLYLLSNLNTFMPPGYFHPSLFNFDFLFYILYAIPLSISLYTIFAVFLSTFHSFNNTLIRFADVHLDNATYNCP